MSGGIQTFISDDGSQVLFDPQSGNYYTLLGNNYNMNNNNYNNQVKYFINSSNTSHAIPQITTSGNYEQNSSNTHSNGYRNNHQRNTTTQATSSKHHQQQQNYHYQSNTWQNSMQQSASLNNILHSSSTDKEQQQINDPSIQASTPLQEEQSNVNHQGAQNGESYSNMTHQLETEPTTKRTLNDSDDFITKGTNKAIKNARHKNVHYQNKSQQLTTAATSHEIQNKYNMPIEQLQRAIVHNLPCFVIKFTPADNLPAAVAVADALYEHFSINQIKLLEEFSVVRYSGIHLKIGVKTKEDYQLLCNIKHWPTKILGRNASVIIPKFVPEQFSLVVRFVPKELTTDQVAREVKRSAGTANNFREIIYPYARATNDFRFSVTDMKEYNGLLRLGHIGIANLMRKITPYRPSNKLTYCTKCWRLGHTRNKCQEPIQKCRICLEEYNQQHNEVCSKKYKCAQCNQNHYSLDGECSEIQQHRQQLNKAVKVAVKDGIINTETAKQIRNTTSQPFNNINHNNYPPLSTTSTTNDKLRTAPWITKITTTTPNQHNDMSNEQLFKKICKHFDEKTEQTNSHLHQMEQKIKNNEDIIFVLQKRLAKVTEVLQSITQVVAYATNNTSTVSTTTTTNAEVNVGELLSRAAVILNEQLEHQWNNQNVNVVQTQDDEVMVIEENPTKELYANHLINPNEQYA